MSSVERGTAHSPDDHAQWPDRIRSLSLAWQGSQGVAQKRRILAELWPLVNAAISRYVRLHGDSIGRVDSEELRDIASEKSIAFLRNLEAGSRDLEQLHTAQIRAYLSVLARNGLVDALRKSRRRAAAELSEVDSVRVPVAPESDGAEINLRHREFLQALTHCVSGMTARAQMVWFFRAFLDMPSKQIALHPDICMTPQSVDMMYSRARKALHRCLTEKGFDSSDAAPGAFVALWELIGGEKTGALYEKDEASSSDR